MSIQEFKKLVERLGVTTEVYPLALPSVAPDEAILLTTGAGTGLRADVQDLILTATVRAKHPGKAESIGTDLRKRLTNLTNETVGDSELIVVRPQERLPQYLGKDSNDYYYFEINFTVLVSD